MDLPGRRLYAWPPSLHFLSGPFPARQAILLDAQTGRVLYEKNADRRGLIASTTKIMTALLICEQCNVLDRVRIPRRPWASRVPPCTCAPGRC